MNESTDKPAASRVRSRASNLKQRVKRGGQEKIESGKRAAADQFEEIADAIDAAGSQLDQSQPTLATYAAKLADGVGGLATRLREDSVEDIYRDVRRVATQHPGLFLLGSAALGVVIARFMKVSGDQSVEAETGGGGDEDLDMEAENESAQDRDDSSSDLTDSSLYGQGGNPASNADEDMLAGLRPARESPASNPYGSPNLGA
jgi:hypothetical protein